MTGWKTVLVTATLAAGFSTAAQIALAASEPPKVGAPAPEFSATDTTGKVRRLSDFAGKTVVLEWHNQGCPYVKKHYSSGNMQQLQRQLTEQGAVWLTVISSAPGKQGYVTAAEETAYLAAQKASPSAVLLDADAKVGRLYGAKTTPHMFVIDPKGILVYAGAIDDKPTTDVDDVKDAKNYVWDAFQEVKQGKPVSVATTPSYGCSVKYRD